MSDLRVCMRDVIPEFNSDIDGSVAFCVLMLFLCSILCLMCSESSLHVGCILPFGMLCLSAWRMMFLKSLISVMSPPPCLCSLSYNGVVGYHRCFSFLCEFCFLYCDDVRLGAVY